MREIYLASDSRARKELLKLFGFKFKVVPSRIKEVRKNNNLSYVELVKKNALAKAKLVARRLNKGIIIGADTIVVQDGRIFGKPRDLKHAKRMLKKLSSAPQWLYTGLALIDKDKNKTLVTYEKTKIYMDKLNDREIADYFKKVSPLAMAGSFDIQGRGALFIRRIEGCFYNVVGLPIRKLYRMFKKIGISLMIFFCFLPSVFCLLLSGCTTEYNIVTGQEETYIYSTEREVHLGKAIAKEVEKEYKLTGDPLIQKRVEDIGKRIARVSDRKDIDYQFKVLDDDEVNAVALPGGIVYINSGLVEKVVSGDEL
ncbi:MAG: Maf family nucleotide pyrophosphatase, partial [Candidatus Omnitrophica bacterium]|nr:Maf family nucleotide pyrophosphatase [Candidatus Omnitrophota bacterium]